MNIDELQQKFNEMRGKKWRTTNGHFPAEISGFYKDKNGDSMIAVLFTDEEGDINEMFLFTDMLPPWLETGKPAFIEEVTPYADWPMDAKARFWGGCHIAELGHFAGISDSGKPMAWEDGKTSWTAEGMAYAKEEWDHAELAEDGE